MQRLRRDRDFLRRSVSSRGTGSRNRDHHRRVMSADARPFIPSDSVNPENPSMPDISSGIIRCKDTEIVIIYLFF